MKHRMMNTARLCILSLILFTACVKQPGSTTLPPKATFAATTTLPSAIATEWIQPAILAGSWYPADPLELANTVDQYLASVEAVEGDPLALIVPHAGYPFSGAVAAYGFKQLEGRDIEVAVVIAADHQYPLSNPISVWAKGGLTTPLGVVAVDESLAQALINADVRIQFDPRTFEGEHPIEIELPFLQRVCPACKVVPILIGSDDEQDLQALVNALLAVLPGRKAVLIASSDLSHYPGYQYAKEVDQGTLAAIETGDADRLNASILETMKRKIPNLATCACGESAIRVVMRVAQGLGVDKISVLKYANSGDSPGGDKSQVVGYGAVMFWRSQPSELVEGQQKELLRLARETIVAYLERGEIPDYQTGDLELNRKVGAFVTLTENGELRGCIGLMQSDLPLYRTVQEMAIAAATQDPRFPPVTLDELGLIRIEISILSPMLPVTDLTQIVIGKHGLMIEMNGHRGVFLPQVPIEQGWDRDAYLENLCYKAGLKGDCWHQNPTLYSFTALVFGEGE